jgi:hypothetical protein
MLIYSYKLEKYILCHFFPKILLNPNSYIIKGSFKRKIPYITDIDVVNKVCPEITKSNIYPKIVELINRVCGDNDIIIVQITCGTDDRFKVTTADDIEVKRIRDLLNGDEQTELDRILKEYAMDPEKKVFYLNELIWPLYKLRWTPYQLSNNSMELRGDHRVSFEEVAEGASSILIQYYLKIGPNLLGVDVVIQYEDVIDSKQAYEAAAKYYLKLSNYKKEYYYMLFPLKNYFKSNQNEVYSELEDVIEKKMGLYKQLMVRIDAYRILYITNNLDLNTAKNIILNLIRDVPKLPNFNSNIITKLQDISNHPNPRFKLEQWNVLLGTLYDQINNAASIAAKQYFYNYLNMIPEPQRKEYYLDFASSVRHVIEKQMVKYMEVFF